MRIFVISVVMMFASVAFADYAQLSSSETQRPSTDGPHVVKMNKTDNAKGITNNNGDVKVSKDGAYFIMAAPQVGAQGAGCANYWLSVNGKDVPNTNVRICASNEQERNVVVSQGVFPLKAGDVINVKTSVSNPKALTGAEAISPPNEPLIPAIIFSMFKIS
jgi:hypothetical protein